MLFLFQVDGKIKKKMLSADKDVGKLTLEGPQNNLSGKKFVNKFHSLV